MWKIPKQYTLLEVCYYKASTGLLNWSESRKGQECKACQIPTWEKNQCLTNCLAVHEGETNISTSPPLLVHEKVSFNALGIFHPGRKRNGMKNES